MTKKEIIDRNITLAFDFVRQIIDNPKLLDDIKDKDIVEFVETDRPIIEKRGRRRAKKFYRVHRSFEAL